MEKRKMIAPIIITVLVILYLLGFVWLFFWGDGMPWGLQLVLILGAVAAVGVAIFVLRERILEIRSGEEDDIGKY